MARPARALLDAQALRHNLALVRRLAPRTRVMAVTKANGYGHGLAWVARTLEDADAFGVAYAEEGVRLREAGIAQPICLFDGFFGAGDIPVLAHHRLAPAIHHDEQVRALEAHKGKTAIAVWVKVDSGMHRLGFAPEAAAGALARLKSCQAVSEIRVMSHLANAEATSEDDTQKQIECFMSVVKGLRMERSLANSAGIIAWRASHLDWVRPGIMLYGASPLTERSAEQLGLKPVMTLETAIMAVDRRRKGERVGYAGEWTCPEDMPVGVAAIGYGDGYPRRAPAGTPVLVNGKRTPLIGRVSMDMITLDLRSQPETRVGDPVVLWGRGLAVEEVAAKAGTISYELLCHVAERVPRVQR